MILTVITVLIVLSLFLRRRPEDYEGEAGPSESQAPGVTQGDLDAVLKFIKAGQ